MRSLTMIVITASEKLQVDPGVVLDFAAIGLDLPRTSLQIKPVLFKHPGTSEAIELALIDLGGTGRG
ncbi:hypothetical protein GCM10010198_41580 [Nocardia seriolae]|nr:hypothetical protein NSER024013_17050 [Nocardia seriolae]GEM28463.1 hypothetical protein NS2_67020 [Nocardia seriolae NBRC 15557]